MAPKKTSRTYEAAGDAAFQAVVRAVERVGMKVEEVDDTTGVVTATTGVTIWSWGERVEVRVAPTTPTMPTTTTNVTVSIALKFQLFGWGQQQRVADGLLDEIGRQLIAAPAPPPPPSPPPPPPPG